jgi:hypothetical protein
MDTSVEVVVDVKIEPGTSDLHVTRIMRKLTFKGGVLVEISEPYDKEMADFQAYQNPFGSR